MPSPGALLSPHLDVFSPTWKFLSTLHCKITTQVSRLLEESLEEFKSLEEFFPWTLTMLVNPWLFPDFGLICTSKKGFHDISFYFPPSLLNPTINSPFQGGLPQTYSAPSTLYLPASPPTPCRVLPDYYQFGATDHCYVSYIEIISLLQETVSLKIKTSLLYTFSQVLGFAHKRHSRLLINFLSLFI